MLSSALCLLFMMVWSRMPRSSTAGRLTPMRAMGVDVVVEVDINDTS